MRKDVYSLERDVRYKDKEILDLQVRLGHSDKVVNVLARLVAGEYEMNQMLFFGAPDVAIKWANERAED